ncbi:hypothetical protein BU16DRAFT_183927 [Lophium mytilinum]|uniref:Uncharacterized protein n=1 Tax=Lophium mytilinum TaxID=390894 RepID=A0A6A6QBK0_9PEZI|nr:hypothetical protein BU16DRAFT_183927 [Lophium mytilinum]
MHVLKTGGMPVLAELIALWVTPDGFGLSPRVRWRLLVEHMVSLTVCSRRGASLPHHDQTSPASGCQGCIHFPSTA